MSGSRTARLARAASIWVVMVVAALVVWLTVRWCCLDAVLVFLVPALLGAVLALPHPTSVGALLAAAVLVGAPATFLLIGGVGLLLVPPAIGFLVAGSVALAGNRGALSA